MKTSTRSVQQIIEEQLKRWQLLKVEEKKEAAGVSIITISREPGSGGAVVAGILAEILGFDLFHQALINDMAESAQLHKRVFESLDEKGLNVLEDWVSSLVDSGHLWPDQYLRHLMKVVGVIGKHGNAVVVGRGANFILPAKGRFRVRMVAPLETRVQNVAEKFDVPPEDARRRILRTEADRRAFVRKYFYADISDPANYDMILNTGGLPLEAAANSIKAAIGA
ncbi:MAG: cytidylate kinase-like family protein [Desulfobacterales bacterium]|nr:cytidylate kinase-like family protein [Desulfobacterales bacterium]